MSDFFNKYPYTDFHELNLDWVIERVKKLTEDWAATLTEWNNTEEEWQQLYDYVHDYFDNLDVQQEINNKINQMILDGTFATIATPIIENQVITTTIAWLAAHITQPTTPAIDNTLSIVGAGADAAKTGIMFANVYDGTATYNKGDFCNHNGLFYICEQDITTPEAWTAAHWTNVTVEKLYKNLIYAARKLYDGDLNDCITSGTYYLGASCTNFPSELTTVQHQTLLVFDKCSNGGNYVHQFLIANSVYSIYHKLIRRNGTVVQDWEKIDSKLYSDKGQYNSDLNNCIKSGTYYLGSSATNGPTGVSLNLTTLFVFNGAAQGGNYIHQFLLPGKLNTLWHRMIKNDGTVLINWELITDGFYIERGNYNSDLNNCIKSGTYYLGSSATNYPSSWNSADRTTLFVFNKTAYNGQYVHQFIMKNSIKDLWHRLILNNGTVTVDWELVNDIDSLMPELRGDNGIIFWGDSLTAGSGGGGTTFPDVCATLLGLTYKNCGVGGETENTIAARQGGNNMIIPAGAVNGTYTLSQLKDMYGKDINPLRQGSGGNTVNPILINGQECTISISQQSITDPDATYTISGYTGTTDFACEALCSGSKEYAGITVIFVGTNGKALGYTVDERISVIRSMISRINNKYVIMGLSIGDSATMDTDDAAMLEAFGNHFFPTRKMLVAYGLDIAGITPTAQDTTDIAAGTVPTSLRNDSTHLNANGYTALGTMLASKIVGLGYATYA